MKRLKAFWKHLNFEEKLLALYVFAFVDTKTPLFILGSKKILYADAVFLFLLAIFIWNNFKYKRNLLAVPLKAPILTMVALFSVSFFNSVSLKDSALELLGLFYCIVIFAAVWVIVESPKKLRFFLYIWLITATTVSLAGLIAFCIGIIDKNLLNSYFLYYTTVESMVHHFPRVTSTFYTPNMFCTYLHASLVFSFILFLSEINQKRRYFIIACILILFTCAFLTGSRRFAGVLLSIFLIALWHGRGRLFSLVKHVSLYGFLFFLLISIVTTIWVIAPVEITKDEKAKTIDIRLRDSYSLHFLEQVTPIRMFRRNPFIGVGFGTYNRHVRENVDWQWVESSFGFEAYPEYIRLVKNKTLNFDPHSVYLGTLAETGIIGFLGLSYFFIGYAVFLIKGARRHRENELVGIISGCILAGFVGFLLNGLTIDILSMRHFWFMLGIGALCQKGNFTR